MSPREVDPLPPPPRREHGDPARLPDEREAPPVPSPGDLYVNRETGERVVVIAASSFRVRYCSENLANAESQRTTGPTRFARAFLRATVDDVLAWREYVSEGDP